MPAVADIVKVVAPSSAVAGVQVIVDVSVKNLASTDKYLAVTGTFDSTALSVQFDYLLLWPGQTVIFRCWFTMPSKDVTVNVSSWYWDGSKWIKDETQSVSIPLAVTAFSNLSVGYAKI